MSRGLLFWIIFVLFLLFGGFVIWSDNSGPHYGHMTIGLSVVQWVLIGLLGWGICGPPVK